MKILKRRKPKPQLKPDYPTIPVKEFARNEQITESGVRSLFRQGKLPGAVLTHNNHILIPKDLRLSPELRTKYSRDRPRAKHRKRTAETKNTKSSETPILEHSKSENDDSDGSQPAIKPLRKLKKRRDSSKPGGNMKRGVQPEHLKNIQRGRFANISGSKPFYDWLDNYQPRILTRSNKYEIFKPIKNQEKLIEGIFNVDRKNNFIHSFDMSIQPRRHGKSTVFALIILYLFTTKHNMTIQLLGNTDVHSRKTQFLPLKRIIQHTPKLLEEVGEKNLLNTNIWHPDNSNIIQMPNVNLAASFGEKLDVLWVSDFHACPDIEPYNALQASLLDSEGSLLLMDSNVDVTGGPVHELELLAKSDSSIFCQRIEYVSWHQFNYSAPDWIDRPKAKRLKKTSLPAAFARDILGQRSNAVNALFPQEIIDRCKTDYTIPVDDIEAITKGRTYKIGGGLDRSKRLMMTKNSDRTIWSVVLKVAQTDGEPEFHLLEQVHIKLNNARQIKKCILASHKKYTLDGCILENYETIDIQPWLTEQKIPCELLTPTNQVQNAAFPEMHRIFKEARFHFPSGKGIVGARAKNDKGFESELQTFVYEQKQAGEYYKFHHSTSKFHDDRVYSACWAIYSLRKTEMNLYVLPIINCDTKSQHRNLCFLMGGNVILPCSDACLAYHRVDEMFRQFKQYQTESELNLLEFFDAYVKTGSTIYQAA